jgi:hypothetical protein
VIAVIEQPTREWTAICGASEVDFEVWLAQLYVRSFTPLDVALTILMWREMRRALLAGEKFS